MKAITKASCFCNTLQVNQHMQAGFEKAAATLSKIGTLGNTLDIEAGVAR